MSFLNIKIKVCFAILNLKTSVFDSNTKKCFGFTAGLYSGPNTCHTCFGGHMDVNC